MQQRQNKSHSAADNQGGETFQIVGFGDFCHLFFALGQGKTQHMCLFPGLFCPDFSFSATLKDIVNIDTSLMRAPSQKIRILLINSLKRNR